METKPDPSPVNGERDFSFPIIQTERLTLRGLEQADQEFLVSLDTNPEVMQYIHAGPLNHHQARSFAAAQIDLAHYQSRFGKWLLELKQNCIPIGWVQVCKYRQTRKRSDLGDDLQLGYELAPENWGFGYATEACHAVVDYALRKLHLDRLVAFTRPENLRSQRILTNLGFTQDGTCKDDARNECLFFVLTRTKWRSQTKAGRE